jgi:hypothetical protein
MKVTPPKRINHPTLRATTIYYMSQSRVNSLYDQLPNEAFYDTNRAAYQWIDDAQLDAGGDQGSREAKLRVTQRQLLVLLTYWQKHNPPKDLRIALRLNQQIDSGTFFECVADFWIADRELNSRLITIGGKVDGYTIYIRSSKSNFLGLSETNDSYGYEANSLMPEFFLGNASMSLLAYLEVNKIMKPEQIVTAGALCLISDAPTLLKTI